MRNKKFQSLIDFIDNQLDGFALYKPSKANYNERFNLAMYIGQYIVKGQNMYLNADTSIPTQDIVDFDNKISICACRLYDVMEGLLAEYIEKRKDIGIEEVGDLLDSRNQLLYISARWNTLQVMKVFDMD